MSSFQKNIYSVLAISLCLQMISNHAASLSIPIPDFKEPVVKSDWHEMGEKGILFFNNLIADTWHETRRNPKLIGAIATTGAVFVLGHKYGHIASKRLSVDKCDRAINKQYLAAKKEINERFLSPVVSRMPSAPFFISPIFVMVKAIGSSVERYFLCSKSYMIGSLASGGGFYLCGHPVAAGFMAALIFATGWINQSTAELKQGQAEIREDIADLKNEVQGQGTQIRNDIRSISHEAQRNKEELKNEIQGVSKQIDGVSENLKQEMEKQIASVAEKTQEGFTRLGTHIDDEFKAMNKNVVGEIANIDKKIIDVLAKIDSVAEEAARKELVEQLSELNKKSEELKASFFKAVQDLTAQGMLTQEYLNALQAEVRELKAENSSQIGAIGQRINTMLDKQISSDGVLKKMQDAQLQIGIDVATQSGTLKKLELSHQEIVKISTDIQNRQELFFKEFTKMTSKFEEDKKQSDTRVDNFFTEISTIKQDVLVVQQDVKELKAENVALKDALAKFSSSFEEYKRSREENDRNQKEKRKKDKKKLKAILLGQQSLHKTVDDLNKNLGAVATAVTGKLDAIGTAMTQQPFQIEDQSSKKEKKSGALLGWFNGMGVV